MLKYLAFFICVFPSFSIGQDTVNTSEYLVVLAHKTNTQLRPENIYMLYSMKQNVMPNQSRAVVVIQNLSSEASIRFFREIFDSFPYQIKRLWDIAVFSGRAKKPVMKEGNQAVLAYIRQQESAVGYVYSKPEHIQFLKENYHVISIYQ